MVPVWISPPPRDVATQTQQRTKAEIFQFRHGTYFSQIVELFRAFVPTARNRRLIVTGATACRHGTDASSTWFIHAACHKKFLCGRAIRLRFPCVVTLCGGPEWGAAAFARGDLIRMADLCDYATRPLAFVFHYVRLRPVSHAVILAAVLAAVACSVGTQYGVKFLVDVLSDHNAAGVWTAFLVLGTLIAADNLLWRGGRWVAHFAFPGVTSDLRRDLFRHLTGHSPAFFADRLPGTLTSRVTATSNAIFTAENMFMWNVLPPCAATVAAIALVHAISVPMALSLAVVAGIMVCLMFRLAAAGRPLHHDFARKAAAVDGEMVDVVSNMPLVRAFGGLLRERRRFDSTVDRELDARRRSLLYLERLRIFHAVVTIVLTRGLLAWAIMLWQQGEATTGDVVLACTLGLSVLHATRDLAVALVDVTQHIARLSEALATLLVPHELRDHPKAEPLVKRGASVAFENVTFRYADGSRVFERLNLTLD